MFSRKEKYGAVRLFGLCADARGGECQFPVGHEIFIVAA
jgi:hypothetical protein